ncbi:MAG: hypothetical protein OXL37_12310 [Chloroflexota bacterium]|nr:hypothetical protein [Chloroflexota bacterium]MDE2960865.1 hypothetical protein [Chloroflexota bacterium]
MDVQIRDSEALRRVTPPMLCAYLKAHQWVHEQTWRNRIMVWSRKQDELTHEILVPLRQHSDAYAVRVSEAVTLLAKLDGRSQLDVYYDLIGAGKDAVIQE